MESIQKYLREGVYWRVFEPEILYVVKSLRVFNVGGGNSHDENLHTVYSGFFSELP